jgi:putative phage-type endonuclease
MSELNIICDTQHTPEWFACRIGCLTSSRIADVVTKRKRNPTEPLQAYLDLRLDLAVERVTGKISENYVSYWMERGTELEPLARAAYELRNDVEVRQTGFVLHPSIKWAGCSPDGLIGDDGLVELKVPKSTTHAEYLLGECVPELYVPQMLWQMACTGRSWCDFASYCPDFPEPLDLFVCRLQRDSNRISEMESQSQIFLQEVEALTYRLKGGLTGALEASIAARG